MHRWNQRRHADRRRRRRGRQGRRAQRRPGVPGHRRSEHIRGERGAGRRERQAGHGDDARRPRPAANRRLPAHRPRLPAARAGDRGVERNPAASRTGGGGRPRLRPRAGRSYTSSATWTPWSTSSPARPACGRWASTDCTALRCPRGPASCARSTAGCPYRRPRRRR